MGQDWRKLTKNVRLSFGYFFDAYCTSALLRSLYIRRGNLGISIAFNCHQLITTDNPPAAGCWLSSTLFMWTHAQKPRSRLSQGPGNSSKSARIRTGSNPILRGIAIYLYQWNATCIERHRTPDFGDRCILAFRVIGASPSIDGIVPLDLDENRSSVKMQAVLWQHRASPTAWVEDQHDGRL